MVLSYTTSPAYHIIAEKTDTLRAPRRSAEGHYMQVEVAARIGDIGRNAIWRRSSSPS